MPSISYFASKRLTLIQEENSYNFLIRYILYDMIFNYILFKYILARVKIVPDFQVIVPFVTADKYELKSKLNTTYQLLTYYHIFVKSCSCVKTVDFQWDHHWRQWRSTNELSSLKQIMIHVVCVCKEKQNIWVKIFPSTCAKRHTTVSV